jgi:hypothetical protein
MRAENSLTIRFQKEDAIKMLKGLIIFEFLLLVVYVFLHIIFATASQGHLHVFFDFDNEFSLPTWFSSMQLFAFALLLYAFSRLTEEYRWFYVLGSAILCFLSIDEFASIHERITLIAQSNDIGFLKSIMIGGHGAWIIPYIILGIIIILVTLKPVIAIYRRNTRGFFIVAAGLAIFIFGVIGLEIISYGPSNNNSESIYTIVVLIEEICEMFGISLAIYGVLLIGIEQQEHETAL